MDPVVITISGTPDGDITLSTSDGKSLTVKDNSTNAKDLFELLDYQPGKQYDVKEDDIGEVKDRVFREFADLIGEIVRGVNELTPEQSAAENSEETAVPEDSSEDEEDCSE